jgi:20S proteasome subunit beta 4
MLLRSRSDPIWPGFVGNSVQFTEFIQKNLHLYQFRNNMSLSTAATANFTRGELATALRKVPIRPNFHPLFPAFCGGLRMYCGRDGLGFWFS